MSSKLFFASAYALVALVVIGGIMYAPEEGRSGEEARGAHVQDELPRYANHAPIRINGNGGFSSANGVVSGNGETGNPYVIEGWEINGGGAGCCIYVGNTTSSFVIRNCRLTNASGIPATYYWNAGVAINNAEFGTIFNNEVSGNAQYGVACMSSNNVNVTTNTLANNGLYGIYMSNSDNCYAYNNNVFNSSAGLKIFNSNNCEFKYNSAHDNGDGFNISGSSNNIIRLNSMGRNAMSGIMVISGSSNLLGRNTLWENGGYGIKLMSSAYFTTISNSVFIRNNGGGKQAYDDSAISPNFWGEAIPNFFSDHTEPDANNDGTVDTPYNIDGMAGQEEATPRSSAIRAPVRIDSNAGFTVENGIMNPWAAGTELDPYIIEEWNISGGDISGAGYRYCFYIGNTTAHFTMRNCTLHDTNGGAIEPFYLSSGLHLYNVTNGTVMNNEMLVNQRAGAVLDASSNNTIEYNLLWKNKQDGLLLRGSPFNTISNNDAGYNLFPGINITASSNNNFVSGNDAYNNLDEGIRLDSSDGCVFVYNSCWNNSDDGMDVQNSFDGLVSTNWVWDNGDDGIEIDNSEMFNITHNAATWNIGDGIFLTYADYNSVYGNNLNNNSAGVKLNYSSKCEITFNSISNNAGHGISVGRLSANNSFKANTIVHNLDGMNVIASDNIIVNNTFAQNLNEGIEIWSSGNDNYIVGNEISQSVKDGILIRDTSLRTTLFSNTIRNNGFCGVNITGSSNFADVLSNTIRDNHRMGIALDNVNYCNLSGNNLTGNWDEGIYLYASHGSIIRDNTLSSNGDNGLLLRASSDNSLINNTVSGSLFDGIQLDSSDRVHATDNILSNNGQGIALISSSNCILSRNSIDFSGDEGIDLSSSSQSNLIEDNTVLRSNEDGLKIKKGCGFNVIKNNNMSLCTYNGMYIINASDCVVENNTFVENGDSGVNLVNAHRTRVSRNVLLSNYYGACMYNSTYCTLYGNVASDNNNGFFILYYSNYASIFSNALVNNTQNGLYIEDTTYSTIMRNNVSGNARGLHLYNSDFSTIKYNAVFQNTWYGAIFDAGSDWNVMSFNNFVKHPLGGTQAYSSTMTNTCDYNYWSDWTTPDMNHDFIVDFPYTFSGPIVAWDRYPLTMMTHEPFRIDDDGKFTYDNGVANPYASGTAADPYVIEGWYIDGTGYGYCGYVGNTTKYFIMRNCVMTNASGNPAMYYWNTCIGMYNVSLGAVSNCTTTNSRNGTYVLNSSNLVFEKMNVTNALNVGINIYNCANCIVNNTRVTGCFIGVQLYNASLSSVENCYAANDSFGIAVRNSNGSGVLTCNAEYCSQHGFFFANVTNCSMNGGWAANCRLGIVVNYSTSVVIAGVYVHDCTSDGIFATHVCGMNITSNVVSSCNVAINVTFSSNWGQIMGNTMTNCSVAVSLVNATAGIVTNNHLSGNPVGVELTAGSDRNTVMLNDFISSALSVHVAYSHSNTIMSNHISSMIVTASCGIKLEFSEGCAIEYNYVSMLRGISVFYSGISVYESDRTILRNNTIYNCSFAIMLSYSSSCILSNNSMTLCGIFINGDLPHWNTHSIDASNLVNSMHVMYVCNSTSFTSFGGAGQYILANSSSALIANCNVSGGSCGVLIGYSTGAIIENFASYGNVYGIYIYNSTGCFITSGAFSNNFASLWLNYSNYNTLSGVSIERSEYGAFLFNSNSNKVEICTFVNNTYGACIQSATDNQVTNSVFTSNSYYGIMILYSSSNLIHHNNFLSNGIPLAQCSDDSGSNLWNSTSEGNYWNDWTTPDVLPPFGIVDQPYNIAGGAGRDNYPLTSAIVTNAPPEISLLLVTPTTAYVGEPISFTCVANDTDGTIVQYVWSSNVTGIFGNTPSLNYSGLPVGAHTITLVVQDNDGAWSLPSIANVVVLQHPPNAFIDFVTPSPVIFGSAVTLSGHGTDVDGTIAAFEWVSSINGNVGNSSNITINSLSIGNHTISFSVMDDNGSWSAPVSVYLVVLPPNAPPTATIVSIIPSPATLGAVVTFVGSGTDEDGAVVAYNWTSSLDGFLSCNASFNTSALSEGKHNITFSVQDDEGSWSLPAMFILTIGPAPPNAPPNATIISIFPEEPIEGQAVHFIGSGTDADGTIALYSWSSDIDGPLGSIASFNTTLSVGTHNITFVVRDDDGNWSAPATAKITVRAQSGAPPTAEIVTILPSPSVEGQAVIFIGASTPDLGIVEWEWVSSIDGTIGSNESLSTSTLSPGIHSIYFMVRDSSGIWSSPAVASHVVVHSGQNSIPSASIVSISPNPASYGSVVSFIGSALDSDGVIFEYFWRSSINGPISANSSFQLSTLSPGTHMIYFTAKDDAGAWANPVTAMLTIVMPNQPPIAKITSHSPANATERTPITFVGSGTDADGTITAYDWTSNIVGAIGSDPTITVSLPAGTHIISLRVQDNNGSWSALASITIIVGKWNSAPMINATLSSITLKASCLLDVSSWAYDPDNAAGDLVWSAYPSDASLFSVEVRDGTKIALTRLGSKTSSCESGLTLKLTDPLGANDTKTIAVLLKPVQTTNAGLDPSLFALIAMLLVAVIVVFALSRKKQDKTERRHIDIVATQSYGELERGMPEYEPVHPRVLENPMPSNANIQTHAHVGDQPINEKGPQPESVTTARDGERPDANAHAEITTTETNPDKAPDNNAEEKAEEANAKASAEEGARSGPSLPGELAVTTKYLLKGLGVCESFGLDVEKIKNAQARLEYTGDEDSYKESQKIMELYLKVALKKGMPEILKTADARIASIEKEGGDASAARKLKGTIEARFKANLYPELVESLGAFLEVEAKPEKAIVVQKKEEKKGVRDRQVFLDGKVYLIFESDTRKSYRILKGISDEGAWTTWLTLDAESTIKSYAIPPNIKVKGLGGSPNRMEAIISEITDFGKGASRYAILVDFIMPIMATESIQPTVRLIGTIGRLIKGKQACVVAPIIPSQIAPSELEELKNVATIIENPSPHINWLDSEDKTITTVVRCHVCMGVVKAGLPVKICSCGKKFHETCASRIGECPACSRKF